MNAIALALALAAFGAEPEVATTPDKLANYTRHDFQAFNRLCDGQLFAVTGKVRYVRLDRLVVVLDGKNKDTPATAHYFNHPLWIGRDVINEIKPGQTVTIIGVVYVNPVPVNARFKHCRIGVAPKLDES